MEMAKETGTNAFINPLINIQYNLTKDIIKYESPFKLRYITFSKIAIIIWQANMVRINIKRSYQTVNRFASCAFLDDKGFEFHEWLTGEVNKLEIKVLCLPMPKCYVVEMQSMVKKMGRELLSYLIILHRQLNLPMNFESLRFYMINAHWTVHGTIDQFNSAVFLLENANLESLKQYEVACHFCVEEIFNSFLASDATLCELQANDSGRDNLLMDFLTFQKTLRNKYFFFDGPDMFTEVFSINYIFKMTIENKYDSAVQYFFENFKTRGMKENITFFVGYALERGASTNALFYLISNIKTIEDTEMLCKEYGHVILNRILEDPRWHAYFETAAKYVLSLIQTMNFESALNCFVICWKKNILGKNYSQIMKAFLNIFKDDIISIQITRSVPNCLLLLSVEDIHFIKAVFGLINAQEREKILYDEKIGLRKGVEWIVNGKQSLFYRLVRETFRTRSEIGLYKNYFSKNTNLEMPDFLILEENIINLNIYG